MQIYLSTLTELDYDKSLSSIEESFDDNPETSWQARAKVKHSRKSPCYNFELEVIAKNENNDVVGHVLLIDVEINSDDKTYYGLAIASLSVHPEYTWDLTTIFKDDEAFEAAFKEVENELGKEDQFKGHIGDSAETLYNAL